MKGLMQQIDPKYIIHFDNSQINKQVKEILSDPKILDAMLRLYLNLNPQLWK